MSSFDRAVPPVMVICCSLPVARSLAETFTIPFASISNATSICGMPRGAGGMPIKWNFPSERTPGENTVSASPWRTWISTVVWLSSAVVKISLLRVGMVVFRSISLVKIPPFVSTPSVSGVTSRSRMSLTSPFSTPAWTAAPTATTSSGFTPLCGSWPPVSLRTRSWIIGMRVAPPTRITWSMAETSLPQSFTAWRNGPSVRSTRSAVMRSNSDRVSFISRCRTLGRRGDERQVDGGLGHLGQLDLGLLGGLLQPLEGHAVSRQVHAVGVLELLHHPVDDSLVPVIATEVCVTVGGLDLEDPFADLQQ